MRFPIILFVVALFLPVFTFAEAEIEKMKIGDAEVFYHSVFGADTDGNGVNDRSSFYLEDRLVFTAYDSDEDGKPELWFQYDDNLSLTKTLVDRNADGKPDESSVFNKEEEVVKVEKLAKTKLAGWLVFVIFAVAVVAGIKFTLRRPKV